MKTETEVRAKLAEMKALVIEHRNLGESAKMNGAKGPMEDHRLQAAWGAQSVAALAWVLSESADPLYWVKI